MQLEVETKELKEKQFQVLIGVLLQSLSFAGTDTIVIGVLNSFNYYYYYG